VALRKNSQYLIYSVTYAVKEMAIKIKYTGTWYVNVDFLNIIAWADIKEGFLFFLNAGVESPTQTPGVFWAKIFLRCRYTSTVNSVSDLQFFS